MSTDDDPNKSLMGARLKEERKRLGIEQQQLAEKLGINRKTQGRYETGDNAPNTRYLTTIAELGFDVVYVLTGRRTPGHQVAQEIRRKHGAVLEFGEIGESLERLEEAEAATGNTKQRDDMERWVAAIAAVEEGLAQSRRRLEPPQKAELILAAYDLLEEDTSSSRDRIIRLVKAS